MYDETVWQNFHQVVTDLAVKCAAPATVLRNVAFSYFPGSDVSFYWNPDQEKAALYFRPVLDEADYAQYQNRLQEKLGQDQVLDRVLTPEDLAQDWWVKVAYSPMLRRMGEILQFFPSQDIPGFGGRPLASTLATGLLGTGLGYGTGYLAEKLMPDWMQESGRTRKSMALTGGLLGAGVGATPGLINKMTGRSFNDPTLWSGDPLEGHNKLSSETLGKTYTQAIKTYLEKESDFGMNTVGGPGYEQEPVIRTNLLGRVLWNNDVNPQLTAMTMGAVYGANQMPDQQSMPGVVTPHQMGLFGMSMGAAGGGIKGYITGRMVGRGLGVLTGMPQSTQDSIANAGFVTGVVNNLVPKLFQ